jgi:hypothetical protein
MWRRRSRLVIMTLTCLALGVLCSLAIVAGIAVREYRRTSSSYVKETYVARDLAGPMLVESIRFTGLVRWTVDRQAARADGTTWRNLSELDPIALPGWVPAPDPGAAHGMGADGFGWPWPCMKMESVRLLSWTAPQGNRPESWGSRSQLRGDFHVRTSRTPPRWIYFPARPIWTGMAANTALFALVPAAAFLAGGARRWARRRRGRCAWCGYDLRGVSGRCPECGRVLATELIEGLQP